MNAFLLPCGCGADNFVTGAQAGGQIRCEACGRDLPIPKFRDLGKLRPAAQLDRPSGSVGRWSAMHTLLLVGGLLAAASGLGSLTITPPSAEVFDSPTLRDSVMGSPTAVVYEAWKIRLDPTGIDRPLSEMESKAKSRSDFYTNLRNGLRAAAVLGLTGAVLGSLGIITRGGKERP
jgi:hypothetical protein